MHNFRDAQNLLKECRITINYGNDFIWPKQIKQKVYWCITTAMRIDGTSILDGNGNLIWSYVRRFDLQHGDVFCMNLTNMTFDGYLLTSLLQEESPNWIQEGF